MIAPARAHVWWRYQNGFTHQIPEFIGHVLKKKTDIVDMLRVSGFGGLTSTVMAIERQNGR